MATIQTPTMRVSIRVKPTSAAVPVPFYAVAALALLAFLPLLWIHAQQLWIRPHYQFFPFVIAGAAVLIWLRFPSVATLEPGAVLAGCTLLAWSWVLLAAAEILNSSWLGGVAFLFLVLAVFYALGGRPLVWRLLPAWVFLWLIVPPPFGLDRTLVLALQDFTTRWSSAILDIFGVYHVVAGNVVEIAGQRLFVEEACTGINSLFSILACTAFYIFVARLPLMRSMVLVLASVFWILLANICRIFLVAFLAKRGGINVAEGWRHDALGFLLFATALVLIWSTDRLLVFLAPFRHKKTGGALEPVPTRFTAEADRMQFGEALRKSWMSSWCVAVLYGSLMVVHLSFYGLPELAAADTVYTVPHVHEDILPKQLAGWQRARAGDETRNPGSAYG